LVQPFLKVKKIIFSIIINMPYGYPVLTPTYGLGSYGRTAGAVLIGSPRNRIGSQGRIYAFMKSRGQGQAYINNVLIPALPPYRGGSRWAGI
jgi:hypothetical protein